ncbi:hypothetical protein pb186bvf_010268 [Paramecium bursaria]
MDQEDDEIRRCFPEYLSEDYNEMINYVDDCLRNLNNTIIQYKDEPSIMKRIEVKLLQTINQTPDLEVLNMYSDVYAKYFTKNQIFKLTKYLQEEPSLLECLRYIQQEQQLSWVPMNNITQNTVQDLQKIFNFNQGKVAKHELLLLFFPNLIPIYYKVLEGLFSQKSSLKLEFQIFIAIIGVASTGCEQLHSILVQWFIQVSDNEEWIKVGYKALPQKLKLFINTCKILSYCPHSNLLQDSLQHLFEFWTKQELVHGFLIFSFYNGLGCYSLGNGITKEYEINSRDGSLNTSMNSSFQSLDVTERLVNLIQTFPKDEQNIEYEEQSQLIQQQEEIESVGDLQYKQLNQVFSKYFENLDYPIPEKPTILTSSQHSFELNVVPLLKEFYPQGADPLHMFLKEIKLMTRKQFGNTKDIDTIAFRRAVWLYGENMYHYQQDGVKYSVQQNGLLHRKLKNFIKIVSQTPNKLNSSHLKEIPIKFKPDEITHIILLTIAAKIETQLIYLTRHLIKFI